MTSNVERPSTPSAPVNVAQHAYDRARALTHRANDLHRSATAAMLHSFHLLAAGAARRAQRPAATGQLTMHPGQVTSIDDISEQAEIDAEVALSRALMSAVQPTHRTHPVEQTRPANDLAARQRELDQRTRHLDRQQQLLDARERELDQRERIIDQREIDQELVPWFELPPTTDQTG